MGKAIKLLAIAAFTLVLVATPGIPHQAGAMHAGAGTRGSVVPAGGANAAVVVTRERCSSEQATSEQECRNTSTLVVHKLVPSRACRATLVAARSSLGACIKVAASAARGVAGWNSSAEDVLARTVGARSSGLAGYIMEATSATCTVVSNSTALLDSEKGLSMVLAQAIGFLHGQHFHRHVRELGVSVLAGLATAPAYYYHSSCYQYDEYLDAWYYVCDDYEY
jgi:hypothetical protein